jgi:hypothetical protein
LGKKYFASKKLKYRNRLKMKNLLLLFLLLFGLNSLSQNSQQEVNSMTLSEKLALVDKRYQINLELKNEAWKKFQEGNYKDAIYFTKQIRSRAKDGGYLFGQKMTLLSLSYAHLGKDYRAVKYYTKLRKSGLPSEVDETRGKLRELGIR